MGQLSPTNTKENIIYVTIKRVMYHGPIKSKYKNKRIPATMDNRGLVEIKGSVLNRLCADGKSSFDNHLSYSFTQKEVIIHDKTKPTKVVKAPKGLAKYILLTDGGYSARGLAGKSVMGRINERHPNLVMVAVGELNKHTTRISIKDIGHELNFILGSEIVKVR